MCPYLSGVYSVWRVYCTVQCTGNLVPLPTWPGPAAGLRWAWLVLPRPLVGIRRKFRGIVLSRTEKGPAAGV